MAGSCGCLALLTVVTDSPFPTKAYNQTEVTIHSTTKSGNPLGWFGSTRKAPKQTVHLEK